MKISTIIAHLEQLAPPNLQENYDNSTLLTGNKEWEVSSVLFSLDMTEEVVEEAIHLGAKMIVAHHPIIFTGLKSLTGKNYIERTIIKAIKNDIALYAIHTNLDNVKHGVNKMLAEKIGLTKLEVLSPKKELLSKLIFYCPITAAEKVKEAIFNAGAGKIGQYDCCSFSVKGEGTFRAGEGTNPHVGKIGEIHQEEELRVEVVLPHYIEGKVLSALIESHPYEEVAYDLYQLKNSWNEAGSGMIGELEEEIALESFLDQLKSSLKVPCIKHTSGIKSSVKKIAVCGGSGSFLLEKAIQKGADVFVSADFKYHQFFDADGKIVIADVGHFESEQYTTELLQQYFKEKLPNFATYLSKINTNPINYR